jgi:hypothetical protein
VRVPRGGGDVSSSRRPLRRRRLQPQAGSPSCLQAADTLLRLGEIQQLIAFADELPQKFPPIVDAQGRPAPADVEFAFVAGRPAPPDPASSRAAPGQRLSRRHGPRPRRARGAAVDLNEALP